MRALLDAHGLSPRRADGQNFVVDANIVRRIVALSGLTPEDAVLEIGPGLGSLTLALAEAARRVVAVEIDAGLVRALEEVLAGRDDVEVVHADALRAPLGELAGEPARLVANLPYSIATPLVLHALRDPGIVDALVMVQREVGERWAARPGDATHSSVSVRLALLADVEIPMRVPRAAFYPVPNVDSVMVRLTRRADAPGPDERARLDRVIETAFRQRRKTLRNTLRPLADAETLASAAHEAGIDLSARAETLDAAAFRELARRLPDPAGR